MTKTTQTGPKPPTHLRPKTRAWWSETVTTWALEPHHILLLTLICEAWDRGQQARETVAAEGLMVPTKRGGPRLHPCLRVEMDCRIQVARLLRELDLDVDPPAAESRPPLMRSMRSATGGDHAA